MICAYVVKKKRTRKLFPDVSVCSACQESSFSTLSANKSRVSRILNPPPLPCIILRRYRYAHILLWPAPESRECKTVRSFTQFFLMMTHKAPQLFFAPDAPSQTISSEQRRNLPPDASLSAYIIITVLLQHTPTTLESRLVWRYIIRFCFFFFIPSI